MTNGDRWTEINVGPEGIGVTLYEQQNGTTITVDEFWKTYAELENYDNVDNIVLDD